MTVPIKAIATANPSYCFLQDEVIDISRQLFEKKAALFERILPSYKNAGIQKRYSCVPREWYLKEHSWKERNELYLENALKLMEVLTWELLEKSNLSPGDIDGIITVSSTGISTPSLDARLADRIPFRQDIIRIPIVGLGCAGGVSGLARAAVFAKAMPGKNILLLVVELNALTFRKQDFSKSNMIATVLFGDGAAGVILNSDGEGPGIVHSGEHRWPKSLDVMGWEIENEGFKVVFSKDIPAIVANDFQKSLEGYMTKNALTFDKQLGFVCHPGGAKVIQALELVFGLKTGGLAAERDILRDYGNMSAPTVLFVLKKAMEKKLNKRTLMTAFGPGFTSSLVTLEGG